MAFKSRLQKIEEALDANKKFLLAEPLELEGFPPEHPRVDAKAAEMADFSRAAALAVRGDGRQFKGALHQFCPELVVS
jgi:hypothetical protein